jgi:uncharacterized membrane protein
LKKAELVKTVREGIFVRIYPIEKAYLHTRRPGDRRNREQLKNVQLRIMEHLRSRAETGMSHKELRNVLRLKRQTLSRYLQPLIERDLIKATKVGREIHYHSVEKLAPEYKNLDRILIDSLIVGDLDEHTYLSIRNELLRRFTSRLN